MLSARAKITLARQGGQVRVLFVVSAFPRHSGDVITPWLSETIRHLGMRGIEVEVLAPAYRGLGTQTVDGITVHRFRYAPAAWETLTHDQTAPDRIREQPAFLAMVPGYVVAGSSAAARLARTGRFDVVHAFWPLPHGLLGLAAKRAGGIPLVCTFFGVELTWMRSQFPLLRNLLRRIVQRSDAVTAISSYTARELTKEVPEARAEIVPFGAAVSGARAPDNPFDRTSDEFEILFVGRLVERKGVRYLLDALARIPNSRRVRLRIVGDGPLGELLRAHATQLGIQHRVVFDGSVPTDILERRFTGCDVFVLPAVVDSKGDTEGLGVVLLEAMIHDKPVIASATGGITDIVSDQETGLLVPPADPAALADAIQELMDEPARRAELAANGRSFALAAFGWPAIIDRLERVYGSVSHDAAPTNAAN